MAVESSVTVVKASVPFLLIHFLHLQKLSEETLYSIVEYHSKHLALLLPCNNVLIDIYQTVLTDRKKRKEGADKLQANGQKDAKNSMRMEGHKARKRIKRKTEQGKE
jgi:hypothetical protein